MARPLASRFFSAFYRWHRQKSSPCLAAPRRLSLLSTPVVRAQKPADEAKDGEEQHVAETPTQTASAPKKPVPLLPKERILRDGVRGIMRKVPASVAILTVAHLSATTQKLVPMGVAVSSLTTVSLDPPLISFNIKEPSKTLDAIRHARGHFRVHHLRADRSGAKVVELFCNGNHTEAYNWRQQELQIEFYPGKKLEPPHILDDAVQATLRCTVTHELPVGDHVVLVARVSEHEAYKDTDAAIAYVDGKYMRMDGEVISSHGKPTQRNEEWSPFDYPFLLGDKERNDYADRLKAMIVANPDYLNLGPHQVHNDLDLKMGYYPRHVGIDVDLLVATIQAEAKREPIDPSFRSESPIVADFYGSLSALEMAQIVTRAKALVKADPQCIESLSWRQLLKHLGVSINANILPSDIMAPLREEGLVGPFKRRVGGKKNPTGNATFTIEYMEQTEHNLREFIDTLNKNEAENMRLGRALTQIGEPRNIIPQFLPCDTRLRYEGKLEQYDLPETDLSGALSPEEARVALRRIIRALRVDSVANFRTQFEESSLNRLMQVGVHPLVAGIDTMFIFSKIQHIYYSTPNFNHVPAAIEKALDDTFADTITRADLEDRVKQFAATYTIRATTWSTPDILAALGLRETATLTPNASEPDNTLSSVNTTAPDTPQPVAGLVLDTLIATILRAQYSKGTPEADAAIAAFLRDRYGFDVVRNAPVELPPPPPAKTAGREALDELERRTAVEMEFNERIRAMEEMQMRRKQVEEEERVEKEKREKEKREREMTELTARAAAGKYFGFSALEELEKAVARSRK